MALSKEQRFNSVLWFLLSNGEDFRILFEGKLYENARSSEGTDYGNWLYCDGELVKEFNDEQ